MQFHTLTVTDVEKTIADAVVITLAPSPEEAEAFAFIPGQHLTFRRVFDGAELRRTYSICASPGDGRLLVGIKRVAGGAFSNWANEVLRPGDRLEAMPPSGQFHLPERGTRHYLAFAGGSGITPLLSMVKTVLEEEPESAFTLVYANRTMATIMFRRELEDLKDRFLDRFTLIHVLEEGQEIELFSGRIDAGKCAALFAGWIDLDAVDTVYLCGPEPMMDAIKEGLAAENFPAGSIHYELFLSAQPGRLARRVEEAREEGGAIEAVITIDGTAHSLRMNAGHSILEAALASGLPVPYSCSSGVCASCMARLTEGEVAMQANHALEPREIEAGYVLTCQSHPKTARVAIDYDTRA